MPLIHQFFVTDEQHEAILAAVARHESQGAGRDAAFAQVMFDGANTPPAAPASIAGLSTKAPAKKTPAKRR